jgi:hypothetical protein
MAGAGTIGITGTGAAGNTESRTGPQRGPVLLQAELRY